MTPPGAARPTGPSGPRALSDEALMAGVGIGDAGATRELIDRLGPRVYGAAVAIVRDRALAEEVAQDAFVRAWRHAPAYDPRRGPVVAWLLRITRNLAIDALRVRRPEPLDPERLLEVTAEIVRADAESHPADVAGLLATLPDEQARALVLAACLGHTADEISTIEAIPIGTAKTRIRLGLAKLRRVIEPASDRPDPGEDR